jgi:hypothetical protein
MQPPLKVGVQVVVRFNTTLICGFEYRVSPKAIVVDGEEPVFVVVPAGVNDHEASVVESLPDQCLNHPGEDQST